VTSRKGPADYLQKIAGASRQPKVIPLRALLLKVLDFVYEPLTTHVYKMAREPQDIMKEYKRRVRARSAVQEAQQEEDVVPQVQLTQPAKAALERAGTAKVQKAATAQATAKYGKKPFPWQAHRGEVDL
jgi:hypothetical protein